MMEEDDWSKEQEANRKPGQKHPTPSPVCLLLLPVYLFKCKRCRFQGYAEHEKSYRFEEVSTGKIKVSRDAQFKEDTFEMVCVTIKVR